MTSTVEQLEPSLQTPGFHGSSRAYLSQLWNRREYVWYVPRSELRSQQMNTVLGNLWHLLNPVLSISVYYLIFGVVLGTDRGVDNFIAFLAIGIFVFGYAQRATMAGAQSITRNYGLIRSITFPRALLPVATVVTEALAFLPGIAVFVAVSLISGETPTWTWMLLPTLVLLHTVFNLGMAFIAARATHTFRDMQNILPFVFRLLFYASGVLFSVDAYLERDDLKWLFYMNPIFDLVALYRWAMLGGQTGGVGIEFACLSIWSIVGLVGGFFWFRRAETTYGA